MNSHKGIQKTGPREERRQAKIQFQVKSQPDLQEEFLSVNYILEFVSSQGKAVGLSYYQFSRSLANIP